MSMASAGDGSDGSFNRTFMELKFVASEKLRR